MNTAPQTPSPSTAPQGGAQVGARLDATNTHNPVHLRQANNDPPKRIFASSLLESFPALHEFDPTEAEYTETEHEHEDLVAKPTVVSQVSPPPLATQVPLLPFSELTDRLKAVNRDATVYRNKRRQRKPPANPTVLLTIDSLTNLLKHVNLSEAADQPIRWDLIDQQTAPVYNSYPATTGGSGTAAARAADSVDDSKSVSMESTTRQILAMLEPDDDDDDDDNDNFTTHSGFTLAASCHSCASSVTWCEGSLYEEITVATAEEEALLGAEEEAVADCISWDSSFYQQS